MNTIILTMDDTIASNDTIVVKLIKAAEACQPKVNGIVTSWQDVAVALIVCLAIALIVIFGICKYYKNKEKDRTLLKEIEEKKQELEKEERSLKRQDEVRNRAWQLEDQERKRKAELQDLKLVILKELCYENKEKDPKMLIKSHDSDELNNYLDKLDEALSK